MRGIKRFGSVISLFLVFSFISAPSSYAGVIYSSDWGATGIGFGLNSGYWAAHKFLAASALTITKIELQNGGNQYTLNIRADSGGSPGSVISTFAYSSVSGNVYTFTGSFTSTAGTYYWLSLDNATANQNIGAATTANDVSSAGWSSAGVVMSSTNGGSTWGTASVGGYNYFFFRMSTATPALTTPNAPVVSSIQNTSVAVSETSSTTNASNYLVKLFQSNGTTLVESKTVASITSGVTFTGLTPATTYKTSVMALGDGNNYLDSSDSAQTSFTTTAVSTISISGSATGTYRTSTNFTFTAVGGEGKVTLLANSKRVPGCINKSTASLTATCSYKPSRRGKVVLSVLFKPNNVAISSATNTFSISVSDRSSVR